MRQNTRSCMDPSSACINRDQHANLLSGADMCPGRLARLELRVALEALLATSEQIMIGSTLLV